MKADGGTGEARAPHSSPRSIGLPATTPAPEDPASRRRQSRSRVFLALGLLAGVAFLFSLLVGRYPHFGLAMPGEILDDELARRLVFNLRLPRILAAFLTGAALSAAGMVLQMIFRNPLVESGFLGVSQGAAFGAAFAIIFLGGAPVFVQLSAASFAFAGLAGSYLLARHIRFGDWVLRLVLGGIAVSALFSSGVGILKYLADPLRQLPEITFWLLGGLWATTWPDVYQILPVVLPGLTILYLMRWRLNILALRDETAFSLGTSPSRERAVLLIAAVASTAAVVSKAGLIGWVGLIVPHIARRLLGTDAQRAVPGSILIGGIFVLLCDDLARTALAGEIPLGIITSLLGAGVFVVLMVRGGVGMRR
jgi:iron complex transport system permease protein